MIPADTSVWVQHFRRGMPDFAAALQNGQISIHPVVLGELPRTKSGTAKECLDFIEANGIYGRGVGWNDLQLLVAARLSGNPLWSLDTRLTAAVVELGVAYPAP